MTRFKAILLACLGSLALATAFVVPAGAIVGGQAETVVRPWMGSLQTPEAQHGCGTSLIDSEWALTAFHCVEQWRDDPSQVQIRFNSNDHKSGGVVAKVAGVHTPPGATLQGSDIALMKLAAPVDLPVAQLADASPAIGAKAHLIGWGLTCTQSFPPFFYCGEAPTNINGVTVPISPDSYCSSLPVGIVGASELCVGSYFAGKSACYGDSGGPAIVGDRVAGITSRGTHLFLHGNCQISPVIYTDVTAFRAWITDTSGV